MSSQALGSCGCKRSHQSCRISKSGSSCLGLLLTCLFALRPAVAEFAASLVGKCRSVDVAAVSAVVTEAQQTAAYLESAVASLHTTPLVRAVVECVVVHSSCMPAAV